MCCARGYPTPIISINGKAVAAPFNLTNGVYEGCALTKLSIHAIIPGTTVASTCSVVLEQTLNCTTEGYSSKYKVPEEAINICDAALGGNQSLSRMNFIVGECGNVV